MSTLSNLASALTGKPVDTPPAPAPVAADHDALFLAQYASVAAAVGYAPPELELQRFKALCSEHGICCYDHAKVKAYLDAKYGGASRTDHSQDRVFTAKAYSEWRGWRRSGHHDLQQVGDQIFVTARPRATWGWRPLRSDLGQQTIRQQQGWHAPSESDHIITSGIGYAKPIPLPVLLTAQKIRDVTPSATFYVSDEIHEADIAPVSDPFLAVQIGAKFFIVERWDEPGFRP